MYENIEIRNLQVCFPQKDRPVTAVSQINTTFQSGMATGLIGESGSGKSVLGMAILQLLPANAQVTGECRYGGRNLLALSRQKMEQLRGREIALIPQNPSESLNPIMKIKKQLLEAAAVHNIPREEAYNRYRSYLIRFGFDPETIGNSYSFQQSGGMNQRILSILGLMADPKWIIADEPTKGLDAILRRQVYKILSGIKRDAKSLLLITHDIKLAGKLCERLLVLYKGELLEQGETRNVLQTPKHPYTKGLIDSLPSSGMVPIPLPDREKAKEHNGCIFYSRCKQATSRCSKEKPSDRITSDQTIVRCFLYA